MTTTVLQAIELRRELEADILKLIGDFERSTSAQIRCINLNHVTTGTISDKNPKRFVGNLNIEVSI